MLGSSRSPDPDTCSSVLFCELCFSVYWKLSWCISSFKSYLMGNSLKSLATCVAALLYCGTPGQGGRKGGVQRMLQHP